MCRLDEGYGRGHREAGEAEAGKIIHSALSMEEAGKAIRGEVVRESLVHGTISGFRAANPNKRGEGLTAYKNETIEGSMLPSMTIRTR